ncbi:LAGLIDADG family homing endonuclease [Streptomyces sp. NPDC127039]|uniref:LAGLIDADG family homing endonuclease n=1 Tax=Streptomyces sp. NPDC127039 TaxID=3347115 RepID=UPI0036565892
MSPPHGEFASRDYLRGLIDADGSVGFTRRGMPFISLSTSSTAIGTYMRSDAQSARWSDAQ